MINLVYSTYVANPSVPQAFTLFPHLDTYGTSVTSQSTDAPTFGEDFPLLCITGNVGRPNDIIHYAWSKDGKNLNASDKYVYNEDYLIIKVHYIYGVTDILSYYVQFYIIIVFLGLFVFVSYFLCIDSHVSCSLWLHILFMTSQKWLL